jgi:acylphosphatase
MIKHFNISVSGRVQGVGYRLSCLKAAHGIGVKGIVKNKPDGSVYIEAEGTTENLDQFVLWCQKGPAWAKVLDIKIEKAEVKNFESFEIIR